MKKLLLTVSLCVFAFNVSAGDDFNRGWAKGWEQGYKHVKGSYAYPSYPPFPPFPPFNEDSFLGGYNLGFLVGIERAKSE